MSNQQMARTNGNTQMAQAEAPAPERQLRAYLDSPNVVARLKSVASKYMQPEELIRLTLIAASRNPDIAKCTPESILRCLMDASALGIRIGGMGGRGWIIPRWNSKIKAKEANFDPGWRGLSDIARRSGVVKKIEARVVHARDHFYEVNGTNSRLDHTPFDGDDDPGPVIAAYAVAFFGDGGTQFEVVRKRDLDKIRAMSASENGPWGPWEDEMSKKSAVRRLCKHLPYDEELDNAIEVSTRADMQDLAVVIPSASQAVEQSRAKTLADQVQQRAAAMGAAPPDLSPDEPPPDVRLAMDDVGSERQPGDD